MTAQGKSLVSKERHFGEMGSGLAGLPAQTRLHAPPHNHLVLPLVGPVFFRQHRVVTPECWPGEGVRENAVIAEATCLHLPLLSLD